MGRWPAFLDPNSQSFLNNHVYQNLPRCLKFIRKHQSVDRPIVSGSSGPTERISSFVDSLLQPIANKTRVLYKLHKCYWKHANSRQCGPSHTWRSLHQHSSRRRNWRCLPLLRRSLWAEITRIPTSDLQELMRLILEENSFKFNERHLVQTHGIATGTKMAVAFSIIFIVDFEKQLGVSG